MKQSFWPIGDTQKLPVNQLMDGQAYIKRFHVMKTDNFVHLWLHPTCKEMLQAARHRHLYKSTPGGLFKSFHYQSLSNSLTVHVIVFTVPLQSRSGF